DLTQEIFTRYWQSLTNGGVIDQPRAFLFKVARNCIIDWYRKKKSVSLDAMAHPETEEPYEALGDDSDMEAKLSGEGRYLVSKIKDLSDGYRDVVYLRFVEGLLPQQIAEILGISPNAVSARITRGIDELRKKTGYDVESGEEFKKK
ncbi:MAG: sigma-70 family RNA polymerase sigma factor, partial [bacterium]|nr:sigma-70 family RNA polymerase sigma factor [bacterium]